MSLDFIYYPVSFILWCWHKVFGFVFGEAAAISWILGIIFLTFTVRGIMFKPFVNQVRSMKKMQEFAPEVKKLQKKYANDKQRQAQEMQKLQKEHGVNPLGSCLPMLLQIPVFIGLNHVLRMFTNLPLDQKTENYFFDKAGVESYVNAKLFGVNLGEAINNATVVGGQGSGWHWNVAPVAIPLMIVASIATHLTARHSVARQNPESATPQTAMMNKLTMYIFPLGVLVFGALFPLGLLFYWLANNGWTLMQQRLVYTKIDKEEETKKAEAIEKRTALGPKPGQKPQVGQKPANPKRNTKAGSPHSFAQQPKRPAQNGSSNGAKPGTPKKNTPAKPADSTAKDATKNSEQQGSSGKGARTSGASSDSTKKPGRKRR
ncbi:membrane protein insertase YidC [Amycolatopsis nigrescens]|uniref:membrane protein insertase YidC n=1 Tax=Amycolatopsis nigrescens TaxID=381445 RepID=UPI000368B257|nr:membrane protein insertase YidC [Amycolatopsis nigrescens]